MKKIKHLVVNKEILEVFPGCGEYDEIWFLESNGIIARAKTKDKIQQIGEDSPSWWREALKTYDKIHDRKEKLKKLN